MDSEKMRELESRLGYHFNNHSLLCQAVTHKSYLNETPEDGQNDNERLEFLGDAVLDLVISEYLLQHYPDTAEGELSKMRARVVSETALARVSRKLDVGRYLLLGRGEEASQGREKPSLLANTLEAIMAAVYLDGGLLSAQKVILGVFGEDLEVILQAEAFSDYKTRLQEICQRDFDILPLYAVLRECGPDHQKTFEVGLSIKGTVWGSGKGRSKKEAEQMAARQVLGRLTESDG